MLKCYNNVCNIILHIKLIIIMLNKTFWENDFKMRFNAVDINRSVCFFNISFICCNKMFNGYNIQKLYKISNEMKEKSSFSINFFFFFYISVCNSDFFLNDNGTQNVFYSISVNVDEFQKYRKYKVNDCHRYLKTNTVGMSRTTLGIHWHFN